MSLLQAFILGIVQGLTEFIPVSSTGHLVLFPWLLKWEIDTQSAFIFDVLVQWGTLLALLFYFKEEIPPLVKAMVSTIVTRGDRSDPEFRLGWQILLSTIPALIGGLLIKSYVETAINSPGWVSVFLIVTGVMLFLAEKVGRKTITLPEMSSMDAIWIGIFQILALLPGISRSGATISAGMYRGMKRKDAARYSFLIALPIMIAAGIIALIDLITHPDALSKIGPIFVGFIAATVVGYASIRWLLKFLSERSLNVFSCYCILIGTLGILLVVSNG